MPSDVMTQDSCGDALTVPKLPNWAPRLGTSSRSVARSTHGLEPQATYELHYQAADRKAQVKGSELMAGFSAAVPDGDGGKRIVYRRK
jgi:hypothetical protein